MKRTAFFLLFYAIVQLPLSIVSAGSYYIDSASLAGGDGTTTALSGPNRAFATIAEAQAALTGDQSDNSLLFAKGGTWFEKFTNAASGTDGHPFIVGSYGSGNAPIIDGIDLITPGSSWSQHTTTSDPVKTEYQESETAVNSELQGGDSPNKWGSGFKTDNTSDITSIQLYLKKQGTPTGNLTVYIWNTSGGTPSALVGTSSNVDVSTLTTSFAWYTFTFTTPVNITGGSDYFWFLGASYSYSGSDNAILAGYWGGTAYRTAANPYCRWSQSINPTSFSSGNTEVDMVFRIYMTTTSVAANVWKATATTEPTQVFFDGVKGTLAASAIACDSARKWFWAGNVLYIYSTTDPDTAHTSPGVEISIRDYCIYNNNKDYVVYQNIELRRGGTANIFISGSSEMRYSISREGSVELGTNAKLRNCSILH